MDAILNSENIIKEFVVIKLDRPRQYQMNLRWIEKVHDRVEYRQLSLS
jgi:hypothetical protein